METLLNMEAVSSDQNLKQLLEQHQTTTKLRIVYDASAKSGDPWLLAQGSKIQPTDSSPVATISGLP